METFYYVLAIVLIFGAAIIFHEAGHFLVAKLGKIRVHEFAIGLGPVLVALRRGDTQYSLRAVPVGGMVRVAGMEGEEDLPDGFNKKPMGTRIGVIAAGPVMNIVLAAVIFMLTYTVLGRPVAITPVIGRVISGKPAAVAGLRPGDRFVSVNNVSAAKLTEMREQIERNPGQPIKVVVERSGRLLTFTVVPESKKVTVAPEYKNGKLVRINKVNESIGQVGIVFRDKRERLPLGRAMLEGLKDTWAAISAVGQGFVLVFQKRAPVEVSGPVGIVGMMYEQARVSWLSFLNFAGIFNVMIAFLNLLPFPALDGSRIVFLLVEAVRRRPIDPRKEAIVHTVGLVILLGFVLIVTVLDILKRWGPQ